MAMSSDRRAHPSDVLRPKNVGAPIKRTEDPRLLTGNGEYTATFTATKAGSTTIVALIDGSPTTSKAPTIKVT